MFILLKSLHATIFLLFVLALSLVGCGARSPEVVAGPTASTIDFTVLQGEAWKGELDYLNYGSEDRSTIPVGLKVTSIKGRGVTYGVQYPGEEQYNAKETISLSKDGRKIDGAVITKRDVLADGTLVLTTQARDTDNDQPAEIEVIYSIAKQVFSITKNVKFDDGEFFNRNVYRFMR